MSGPKFSKLCVARVLTAPLAICVCGAPAYAQQNSAVDARTGQLEDIIVTAQKRSQNMQDVPIAVSAVSGETIDKAGINDIVGLRVLVPSLNVTASNGRLTMGLRGIGTTAVGPGIENPVALYVDGVYYSSSVASLLSLNNISGIEVLKGPQGTLFGRNATGGLVQITTKTPPKALAVEGDLSYGNYDNIVGRLYIGAPLSSNLAADIAVYARHQGEGWGKNLTDGRDIYAVDHDIAIRSKIVFTPGNTTTFTLIGDYSDTRDTVHYLANNPGSISPFLAGPAPSLGYDVNTTPLADHTVKAGGVSLRYDQKIGHLTLSSITAYRTDKVVLPGDVDGVAADLESYVISQRDTQFSQELQLSSPSSGRLVWTAGLYYFYSRNTAPTPSTFNDAGLILGFDGVVKAKSKAIYGQAAYEIIKDTRLTLGGRYTSERREALDASLTFLPIGLPPSAAVVVPSPDSDVTFNKFTFRASLDHRFSDAVLAYASFNRGFKSGGYNLFSPGAGSYRPEVLDTYEVGLKTDLLDRRLRLNVAAFQNDYRDIQVSVAASLGYNIGNGGTARVRGVDMDLTAAVTPEFRVSAGAIFISPKFTQYDGCPIGPQNGGPPTPGSCAGNLLPLAAKTTLNLTGDYTIDIGRSTVSLQGTAYYNSGFFFESDNVIRQKAFPDFAASIRWTPAGRNLYVGLFGKNLSNQRVKAYGISLQPLGIQTVQYAAPRTYGVTIGTAF